MLDVIRKKADECINEIDGISIESFISYGDKKVEYSLSFKEFMASVSILSDFTYDFFAIEIETERAFMFNTKQFQRLEDVVSELKKDLFSVSNLGKGNI
ncbi:hypothetical protein GC098_19675 [Paenibacillus sp. LMG 31458]|uniref:Carrier domain-containing protein n=1 Tax=Paenibacillus phytorum TaxID=2654977 RepID=A0ABX1XZE8_9BACL|nr:hypothetical protein [Paenibacillus phytorum]NOU73614.1 hypothetical protein [Paenibacillus phytorum]